MGGTNLRAAAVTRDGKILQRIAVTANPMLGRASLLGEMAAVINDLRSAWGTDQLAGIGLGVPGFILLKEGVIRNSNNLACLEDFPFRDEMEGRLGTKVVLENDANAAALGEKWMGAGRDVDDLVLLTLGTGIGGGIISHGKGAARIPRDGRRTGASYGRAERASMRLRESRLCRETRVGHGDYGDGAGHGPWRKSHVGGRIRFGQTRQ